MTNNKLSEIIPTDPKKMDTSNAGQDGTEEGLSIMAQYRSDPANASNLDKAAANLERIQTVRKALGLTQQFVADEMGIAQKSVSEFEAAEQNLNLATLRRIAEAMECQVAIQFIHPSTGHIWPMALATEKDNRLQT